MTAVRRSIACAVAALMSAGCLVSSLHPVYDAKTIVFDEALLGTWSNAESEIRVVISRGEWRSYRVEFTDRFGTTRYEGHLTDIGKSRLLNVRPAEGLEQPPFVVATNGFLHVVAEADRVRLREPAYDALLARAAAGTLGVAAATDLKQNVLITAPTSRVRTWLAAAVADPKLWAEWKTFTRVTR